MQRLEKKNLAFEALRRLLNDSIRSRRKLNVVQTKLFSERLDEAVARAHRECARARMRVLIKHISRKYGYPPDLQDAAVQTVLRQAEELTSMWARNERDKRALSP